MSIQPRRRFSRCDTGKNLVESLPSFRYDRIKYEVVHTEGKEGKGLEKYLTALFDFQRFEKNAELQAVVDSVHARYKARKLSDDEVEVVAAAGMPEATLKPIQNTDRDDGFGTG